MSAELKDRAAQLAAAAVANTERYQLLEQIDYPDSVRIAVNFTCDFDAMLLRRLLNEPVPQRAQGEFGGRVTTVSDGDQVYRYSHDTNEYSVANAANSLAKIAAGNQAVIGQEMLSSILLQEDLRGPDESDRVH